LFTQFLSKHILLFKNIITSSGSFGSKSLLDDAPIRQGHQQDQHAGHLQRAPLFSATRSGIYGICYIAQTGIPAGVADLKASGTRGIAL